MEFAEDRQEESPFESKVRLRQEQMIEYLCQHTELLAELEEPRGTCSGCFVAITIPENASAAQMVDALVTQGVAQSDAEALVREQVARNQGLAEPEEP